jgi:hypothetical protein
LADNGARKILPVSVANKLLYKVPVELVDVPVVVLIVPELEIDVAPVIAPPAAIPAPVMSPLALIVLTPDTAPALIIMPLIVFVVVGAVIAPLMERVETPDIALELMVTPPMLFEVALELEMFPLEVTCRTTTGVTFRFVKYQFAFDALKLMLVFDAAMTYAAPLFVT